MPRKGNRARVIVYGSVAVGLTLIFASALHSSFKRGRLMKECQASHVPACLELCYHSPHLRGPCDKLADDCQAGVTLACQAQQLMKKKRRRSAARWLSWD